MKKIWLAVKDYVFIIIAVVLIRTFLMTPAIVDGASMNNTLIDGEFVIINKLVYRVYDIERFDVVVVNNREDHDKIIKRVIGLPNETITYKDNALYINGELYKTDFELGQTNDFTISTLEDEYLVLGDNREVSKDSRVLGNFKKKDILGRVKYRLYPFKKFGNINK